MKAKINNRKMMIRHITQFSFLMLAAVLVYLLINGLLLSAHQFCPYSQICFGVFSLKPEVIGIIFKWTVILSVIATFATIFIGRMFCGYVCPIGTISELIYKLNKRKNILKKRIPQRLHNYLIFIKYMVLLLTIIMVISAKQYLYMKYCPVFLTGHPQNITLISAILLFVLVLKSYFSSRFWCKYLCPFAALMNIFQYLGKLLKIKRKMINRNIQTSIGCKNCAHFCPMQIELGNKEIIDDVECIHCRNCVRKCAIEDKSRKNCICPARN